jgi:tetratricopeptide (TPR) repeat protein
MNRGAKSSLRARLSPLLPGAAPGLTLRRATDFVARRLLRDGTKTWQDDPHKVREAIEMVEKAWALTGDPAIAIQLVTMYDRVNRADDALAVLRQAFRADPRQQLVRHHAAITLLRHGTPDAIEDFFASVLAIDPDDAFARFIVELQQSFDRWTAGLVAAIERARDGRTPFIISCPVWGQPYSDYFVRFLCATLLAPGNLPALAQRHAPHLVIFTTPETEAFLRGHHLFARIEAYAQVHFVHYDERQVKYGEVMAAHYGDQKVYYSDRPLAFYYARNCKFALMSCAHYVALAAGRATDAFVSGQVADLVLTDGALLRMAELLSGPSDAVLFHAIQVHGRIVRPILDAAHRHADGALVISGEACTKLLIEHIPERNFTGTDRPLDIPLRICWRVGTEGILVHGNHYHPIALRPRNFEHPLRLTIDPIDSRFVDRSSLQRDRIHLVQDASIVGLSVDDDPLLDQEERGPGPLSADDFALWLWGYWGRLRAELFRTPVRFGPEARGEAWPAVERAASAAVEDIVQRAAALEASEQARKSWRLKAGRV